MTDYEQTYEDFWKPLLEKDGKLDMDKLKRELYDYWVVMSEVSFVYSEITGSRITKPNTPAEDVIAAANDYYATLHICPDPHD